MPGTYSALIYHVVFSTRRRAPLVTPELRQRLYDYIGGIVRSERGVLRAIGGMPDHVHLCIGWRPDGAISDLMRTVKGRSSHWVNESIPAAAPFRWQEGHSVFSVSKSAEPAVRQYIEAQEEHHRARDFREELLALLRAHGVEFDERYVFQ